ncbi:hypothetical protein BSKO_08714 [Bryopsis sp. KO-2023]|nr:hypothetical protein BSKO_08714 [Bryopsis sp. KO-2023]
MGSEHGSFTSRNGGSFTAATSPSPWSHMPPTGYFSPMSVQYPQQAHHHAHAWYFQGAPHSPYQPAPMPPILPQNSYLIDDHATGDAPTVKKGGCLVTPLPTLSVFSALALLVVSILTFIRDHDEVSVTAFWLFALGGLVASAVSFCSAIWGHKVEPLGRIGLFSAACGCGVSSAYWFVIGKEGVGVLMGGQAMLALVGLFCGNAWVGQRAGFRFPQEDFSFTQSLMGGRPELRIGH